MDDATTTGARIGLARLTAVSALAIGCALVAACADGGKATGVGVDGSPRAAVIPGVTTGQVMLCKVGSAGTFTVAGRAGVTMPGPVTFSNGQCSPVFQKTAADDVTVTVTETGAPPGVLLDHIVRTTGGATTELRGTSTVSVVGDHGAVLTYYNMPHVIVCKQGPAGTFAVTGRAGVTIASLTLADGQCQPVWQKVAADDVTVTVTETPGAGSRLDHVNIQSVTSAVQTVAGTNAVSVVGDHGAVLTFVNVPGTSSTGCTYTQGYYKNKGASLLPSGTFYLSGQTYLAVLETAPKGGNAYYILAHQFIAASANVARGASAPQNVKDAIAAAAGYFAVATPANPLPATYTNDRLTGLADLLDRFNNGALGPGHCDD